MNTFADIFKVKYSSNNLAHFYILSGTTSKDKIDSWPSENISKILAENNSKYSYEDHPDVLIIKNSLTKYTLKSGEFEDVYSFLSTRPIELNRKFIVIHDAHKISEILLNKLLKTFEEPEIETTILMLNELKAPILATIKSRAIQVNINTSTSLTKDTSFNSLSDYVKTLNSDTAKIISDYLAKDSETIISDSIKKKVLNEEDFLDIMTTWCIKNTKSYKRIDNFQKALKEYQKHREYNNPMLYRVISLLHSIK